MVTSAHLSKCITKKSREINVLRETNKEEFKGLSRRIKRYYTHPSLIYDPFLLSHETLGYFNEIGIITEIKDYEGIITFKYPNEKNGGKLVKRHQNYNGVFTQLKKSQPIELDPELWKLDDWGIIIGGMASGEVLEPPKNLDEIIKEKNKKIITCLLSMEYIENFRYVKN